MPDRSELHPSLLGAFAQLELKLREQKISVRIVEVVRSPIRQAQLYSQGRHSKGPIVTHARPGESAHQWGLAVDVEPIPLTMRNWKLLRHTASRLGFGLLGEWDPGHLQHPQWPQILAYLRRSRIV